MIEDDISSCLLMIAQMSVICFSCKNMSSFDGVKDTFICPSCGASFNYFTFKGMPFDARYVDKILQVKKNALFIDYQDFQKEFNKKKAKDFFT